MAPRARLAAAFCIKYRGELLDRGPDIQFSRWPSLPPSTHFLVQGEAQLHVLTLPFILLLFQRLFNPLLFTCAACNRWSLHSKTGVHNVNRHACDRCTWKQWRHASDPVACEIGGVRENDVGADLTLACGLLGPFR